MTIMIPICDREQSPWPNAAAALRDEEESVRQQQQQPGAELHGRAPPTAGGNGLPQQDEQDLAAAAIDEMAPERKPYHQ